MAPVAKAQHELRELVRKAFEGISEEHPVWKAFMLSLEAQIAQEHLNVRAARDHREQDNCLGRETALEDYQAMILEQFAATRK
jgi:hypothetical protein